MRYLADSNRRQRFCRPLPNHSAKVPIYSLQRLSGKFNNDLIFPKCADKDSIFCQNQSPSILKIKKF